jgi:cyanophycinase
MNHFTSTFTSFVIALSLTALACQKESTSPNDPTSGSKNDTIPKTEAVYTTYLLGNAADVQTATSGGTVLMGGSSDVDEAFRWMIGKSGGGDFVVIRTSGAGGYNSYVYSDLGGVNSCETIMITSKTIAQNPSVATKIRNAEALFIAGGDQATYVNYWKDTPVEEAINYLINTKKVPVGGTSAGCAIMGQAYYSALSGSITSEQMLADPYHRYATIGNKDFVSNPFLNETITDTHYDNPDRKGRHLGFLAIMSKDWNQNAKGIGVEEKTAVLVDEKGMARVVGTSKAYFLQRNNNSLPETCVAKTALTWNIGQQAVKVYEMQAASTVGVAGTFNLTDWTSGSGGIWKYMSVQNGVLSY